MSWGKKRVLSALCSQNICLNELVARSLKTPLDENRRDNWPFLRKRHSCVKNFSDENKQSVNVILLVRVQRCDESCKDSF